MSSQISELDAVTDEGPEASEPVVEENIGLLGRAVALPLIPFVALWEALKAGWRGIGSLARWLGSLGAVVDRLLGRGFAVVARGGRAIGSLAAAPCRQIVTTVRGAARAVAAPARRLVGGIVAIVRRSAVALRSLGKAWAMSIRSFGRAIGALARRIGVSLRLAARAIALPLRTGARAVAAFLRRWGVAARVFAKSCAVAVRSFGRAVASFARRIAVPVRAVARALSQPIRAGARLIGRLIVAAGVAVARTWRGLVSVVQVFAVPVRRLSDVARRVGTALSGWMRRIGTSVARIGRATAQICAGFGRQVLRTLRFVAVPFVAAAAGVRYALTSSARIAASSARWAKGLLVRALSPVRSALGRARTAIGRGISVARRLGPRVLVPARSAATQTWRTFRTELRRARMMLRRARITTRQVLRDARRSIGLRPRMSAPIADQLGQALSEPSRVDEPDLRRRSAARADDAKPPKASGA